MMVDWKNIKIGCCLLLIMLIQSCTDVKGGDDNGGRTKQKTLYGTFESEYTRYQKGEKVLAQLDTTKIVKVWIDTLWKNERTCKQLIVWSPQKERIENLSYVVSDLKDEQNNTINSSAIKLQFITYVWGNIESLLCGKQQPNRLDVQLTDALLDNEVNLLESTGESLKIWITVNVPQTTPSGKYKGTIQVKSGETMLQTFTMDFLVVNKQLPQSSDVSFHLDLWQFPFQLATKIKATPFSQEYFNVIEPFYKMLADAGQKAITTYIKDGAFNFEQTMIQWTKKIDGTWSFNFTDFDNYVEKMMSWGITKQINCVSILGWNPKVIGYFDEQSGSRKELQFNTITDIAFTTLWHTMLTQLGIHLKAKGWFDKAVLYMDEETEEDLAHIINLIQNNDTAWKIGLAGRWMSESTERKLYDYSTVLGFNRYSPDNNSVATFYTSCSQQYPNNYLTPQNSPSEMTWMAWHARAKGLNGYLRWAYDYWQNEDPFNACDKTNTAGDFSMIYRSSNSAATCKPVASIRFELLRKGIQDYEKIRILDHSGINSFVKQTFGNSSPVQSEITQNIIEGQSLIKKISTQ